MFPVYLAFPLIKMKQYLQNGKVDTNRSEPKLENYRIQIRMELAVLAFWAKVFVKGIGCLDLMSRLVIPTLKTSLR